MFLKNKLRIPSILENGVFMVLSPILLPVEEALYAYDHLRAQIRYKKTFLGNEEKLKFEDFDDNQMIEVLKQAQTYKTVIKQKTLLATRETQVVIQISMIGEFLIMKNFRMIRSSFNTSYNQPSFIGKLIF